MNIIGFIIVSLNNTATYLFWVSFISFLIFITNENILYKHAFFIMIISLIICSFTPNKNEYRKFFQKNTRCNCIKNPK